MWDPTAPQNYLFTLIKDVFSVTGKVQPAGGCGCSPSIITSPVTFPSSSLLCFLQSVSSGWWKLGANV